MKTRLLREMKRAPPLWKALLSIRALLLINLKLFHICHSTISGHCVHDGMLQSLSIDAFITLTKRPQAWGGVLHRGIVSVIEKLANLGRKRLPEATSDRTRKTSLHWGLNYAISVHNHSCVCWPHTSLLYSEQFLQNPSKLMFIRHRRNKFQLHKKRSVHTVYRSPVQLDLLVFKALGSSINVISPVIFEFSGSVFAACRKARVLGTFVT